MSYRIERVNELVKEELGMILLKDTTPTGSYLITITTVETSRDLRNATVRYSVIPDGAVQEVEEFFEEVVGEVQHKLMKRLKMRPIPRLTFVYDPREREAAYLDKLIENSNKE